MCRPKANIDKILKSRELDSYIQKLNKQIEFLRLIKKDLYIYYDMTPSCLNNYRREYSSFTSEYLDKGDLEYINKISIQ